MVRVCLALFKVPIFLIVLNKFGFFPGISLGYVISEEDFFKKKLPFISFAKVRASWGQTGNDLIDPYQYLASYTFNDLMYLTNNGATMNQALKEGVAPNQNVNLGNSYTKEYRS